MMPTPTAYSSLNPDQNLSKESPVLSNLAIITQHAKPLPKGIKLRMPYAGEEAVLLSHWAAAILRQAEHRLETNICTLLMMVAEMPAVKSKGGPASDALDSNDMTEAKRMEYARAMAEHIQ